MRRLQIHIDEEVSDRLSTEATRRGVSMAEIVREAVGAYLGDDDRGDRDALDDLVGAVDADSVDDIDEVIYR